MTSGADPRLVERLAETQARVREQSTVITERVRTAAAHVAERADQRRQVNEAHSKELDKLVEDRKAAKADPNSGNQWLQRTESYDHTFQFGEDEQRERQPAPPAPAPMPEPRLEAPEPRRRGRHARPDDRFDDDDFSNNNWMK
ncbi:hypothetical protein ABZ863_00280 [Saccharomonospora sp. NPDC046836]|uniref:hypothetical protein n=1 Tax=Saccharomonospora sp. NPDC046836 TaxID=3156921 RepID=UPI00340BAFEC